MKSSSLLRSHPRDIVAPVRITYILSAKLGNGTHRADIISTAAIDTKNVANNFLLIMIIIMYLFIEEEGTIKYYEMKKIDTKDINYLEIQKC